ncbi:MAG: hypothetical protein AAF597_20125, partial [Bacteroidota bacterium]
LLKRPLGKRSATVVVTTLGILIGGVLLLAGYYIGDFLLMAGAVFIIGLSVLEYRNGWQRRLLAGKSLATVLRVESPARQRLYPNSTVKEAQTSFSKTDWPVLPVFSSWNELLGFIEASHLKENAKSSEETIADYLEAEFATAGPEENLLSITEKIVDANVYGAAVSGPRGQITGYVFTEDVMPLLERPYRKLWNKAFG